MRVIKDINKYKPVYEKPVLTIGKFDGVHRGHKRIFEAVCETAANVDGTPAVITFKPHPKKVLLPSEQFELLTTPKQKIELIRSEGLKLLFIQPFTPEFSIHGPEEFVKEILVTRIQIHTLVLGVDFSFGRSRSGDIDMMIDFGNRYRFVVEVVDPVMNGGDVISSTTIRNLLKQGNINEANHLLGRRYFIDGIVIKGEGRGRQMHVPTANVRTENELIPAQGVYITVFEYDNRRYQSLTNIGIRPTFGGNYLSIEVHLLDSDLDLYGMKARIYFLSRLRDELKFDTADRLRNGIMNDIAEARKFFSRFNQIDSPII